MLETLPAEESLGVVALSRPQADLIQSLIDLERIRRRHLDDRFREDVPERFFVKNLENVQGDERDHVVLSIGYGPTAAGVVRNNFGPLNRAGGERRLNVAVTRARRSMTIVRSLRPESITSTTPGARQLRRYLEYAQKPETALDSEVTGLGEPESPFEEAVRDALRRRGHRVESQVGVSGYRIDLAIRSESGPGFDLGIECDGATYHSSPAARDRDWLRQNVLEGLGWRIHRVWSTAWIRDPDAEVAAIEEALERARATQSAGGDEAERSEDLHGETARDGHDATRENPAGDPSNRSSGTRGTPRVDVSPNEAPPEPSSSAGGDDEASPRDSAGDRVPRDLPRGSEEAPAGGNVAAGQDPRSTEAPVAGRDQQLPLPPAGHQASGEHVLPAHVLAAYVSWHPSGAIPEAESISTEHLVDLLTEIVAIEGPVVARRAYRVIVRASGKQYVTQRARRALNRACSAAERQGLVEATDILGRPGQALRVLWLPGAKEAVVRKRGERRVDEMPPDEVLALLRQLLEAEPAMKKADLKQLVLESLGWGVPNADVHSFLDDCIALI